MPRCPGGSRDGAGGGGVPSHAVAASHGGAVPVPVPSELVLAVPSGPEPVPRRVPELGPERAPVPVPVRDSERQHAAATGRIPEPLLQLCHPVTPWSWALANALHGGASSYHPIHRPHLHPVASRHPGCPSVGQHVSSSLRGVVAASCDRYWNLLLLLLPEPSRHPSPCSLLAGDPAGPCRAMASASAAFRLRMQPPGPAPGRRRQQLQRLQQRRLRLQPYSASVDALHESQLLLSSA